MTPDQDAAKRAYKIRQRLDDAFPPRVKDRLGLNRGEYQRLLAFVDAAVAEAVRDRDARLAEVERSLAEARAAHDTALRVGITLRDRLAEARATIERKNAALARPCISCGYESKIVKPATPSPDGAPGGAHG